MPDKFSKATRSKIMSKIGRYDTKPELLFRNMLFRNGYRYRKNYRVGSKIVDIAFPKKRIAIFIDGCFWHGCPKCYKEPKSNRKYWIPKIKANRFRDRNGSKELRKLGWNVIRIWEHDLGGNLTNIFDKATKIIGA